MKKGKSILEKVTKRVDHSNKKYWKIDGKFVSEQSWIQAAYRNYYDRVIPYYGNIPNMDVAYGNYYGNIPNMDVVYSHCYSLYPDYSSGV